MATIRLRSLGPVSGLVVVGLMGGLHLASAAPVKAKGNFSLYYVAEVVPKASGGVAGKVKTTEGKWETYRLSPGDTRKANMEGSVSVKDAKSGETVIVSISKIGSWLDLHPGWAGKGNRMNPLVPYRTLAADQKRHPYGSHVFIPELDGYVTPEGETLDGHFWVADVGGGIKGSNRFDVFVGKQSAYQDILGKDVGKWTADIEVENLPKIAGEFNPRTDSGVKRVLEGLGWEVDAQVASNGVDDRKHDGDLLKRGLTEFQKQHPHIPEQEYGSRRGAITLWYLSKAALALKAGEKYPASPVDDQE